MNAPEPLGAQLTFELIAQLVREDKYHYSSQAEDDFGSWRSVASDDVQVICEIILKQVHVLECIYRQCSIAWSYLVLGYSSWDSPLIHVSRHWAQ